MSDDIDLFYRHVNLIRVILYPGVMELHSLYLYIYNLYTVV